MPPVMEYYEPETPEGVLGILSAMGDEAKIVAGATALTILLRQGLIRPRALVSLAKLHELGEIRQEDGFLSLGALTTHGAVELSSVVHEHIPALAYTFGVVGNVRIRNTATVGGVMAEADYASDPPAALLALDSVVEVLAPGGPRFIPVAGWFRGFYETSLAPDEMVVGVRIPIPADGTRAVYEKFVSRSAEDRPCVGVFALIRMDNGVCQDVRVAVGAASEIPQRYPDLEALAVAQRLEADVISAIANGYAERIDTLGDMRGSAWYRTEMVRVWVRRALEHALELAS
jgi:carbon-monoxide dehydrogenase medium subunit